MTEHFNIARRAFRIGLISATAWTSPSLAQAAIQAPAVESGTREVPEASDDIIVTGTRRDESVRDVPFNIQAITADTLEKTGASDLRDFARTVPGLSITDGGPRDGIKLVLRGLRTGDEAGLMPTTAVYVDEVPMDMPYRGSPLDLSLVDIERVEVLRGPQGTLFGGGSIGGTLRYISRKPDMEKVEGRVGTELSATRHGGVNYNLTGMLNVPLADWIAVRANVGHFDNDGFIDNVRLNRKNVNDDKTTSARIAVLMKPIDNLDISMSYYRQTALWGESNAQRESQRRFTVEYDVPGSSHYRAQLANLTLAYEFGWASLTSSTSYVDERLSSVSDATFGIRDVILGSFLDPDEIPEFTAKATREGRSHSLTQEVRLVSNPDGPFDWILGGYYQKNRVREVYQELALIPFPGQAAYEENILGVRLNDDKEYVYDSDNKSRQFALFGELKYNFTEAWQASVGGRYFKVRGTGDFFAIDQWFGLDGRDADGFARTTPLADEISNGRYRESGTVWRFNSSYKFGSDGLVYVTVAQGFRPGGFNLTTPNTGIPPEDRQYDSDDLVSYEIGGKFSLFQRRLYVSSALFRIDWSGIQTTVRTPLGFSYLGNAGKAVSQGIELELNARDIALPGLSFSLGYSYTDAKLRQSIERLGFKGEHMPMVPRHSLSLAADYSTEISGTFKAGLNWLTTYTSSSRTDFGPYQPVRDPATDALVPSSSLNQQYLPLGGYWLTSLSLRLEGESWTARLFADNLFDTQYTTGRSFQNAASHFAGPDIIYTANRPRTVGLELTKRF